MAGEVAMNPRWRACRSGILHPQMIISETWTKETELIPEIETWSASRAQTSTQSHTPITPENMYLQQNMFPPRLWDQVFEGRDLSEAQKRRRAEKERE